MAAKIGPVLDRVFSSGNSHLGKFIVPDVTFRKIYGKEDVSFYGVAFTKFEINLLYYWLLAPVEKLL